MISRTSEYALRAIVWLAGDAERSMTTKVIAAATHVPVGYLAKVMQQLVDAGIVTSQRGLGGGFLLTRPAAKISVLEVVNAVDPIQRIRKCPLDLQSHSKRLCPLHRRLDAAIATVETSFAECTIAEVIGENNDSQPLCDGPRTKRSLSLTTRGK